MGIFMIATIKKQNNLVGIRLFDSKSEKVMDVPLANAIKVISSGTKVENVEVVNGELKGTNGSIDRYCSVGDEVKDAGSITIVNRIEDIGFKIVDYKGEVKKVKATDLIKVCAAGKLKLANGKILETTDGNKFISSISGNFEVEEMTAKQTVKKEKVESKAEDKDLSRMKQLVETLNKARYSYEVLNNEIMSNYEYDKLYDELLDLEKKTGKVMKNSPTRNVGASGVDESEMTDEFGVVSKLEKREHAEKMLSLDKTKEIDSLKGMLGKKEGVLSWKLDGLTVVLTYRNGNLVEAVTRGNGSVGELVTHNAKHFKGVPKKIDFKGELVVRGEAIISYSNFEKINAKLDVDSKYKNPRNLASGSVRQLDAKVSASRHVEFIAFNLVKAEGLEYKKVTDSIKVLTKLGFNFVESKVVTADTVESVVLNEFKGKINTNDFPSDGLVLTYNDIAYGKSLGRTAKFPRHSIAFKWADDIAETELIKIEWSPSRTGLINPIAVFKPVELEGTTVQRASLHNLSMLKETLGQPYKNQKIGVFKANLIIPQVAYGEKLTSNNTSGVELLRIPNACPCCNGQTQIKTIDKSDSLYCPNSSCPAKGIKLLKHFVSRDAMNIDGLSEATLIRFIEEDFISSINDIYNLEEYKDEIINLEGFGVKSYNKLISAIDKSRKVKVANLIYALGIPNVGLNTAKLICEHYNNCLDDILHADYSEILDINGIGEGIAMSFVNYFENDDNWIRVQSLLEELDVIEEEVSEKGSSMSGLTFCVTGSVNIFPNRRVIKEIIESNGGKLTGSVSKSTSYLVTNDTTSGSNKNKKAAEYGIEILTEEEFISKFNIEV